MNLNNAGIYIHIPFCRSKCPYCDFYSLRLDEDSADAYTDSLLRRIPALASRYGVSADTIYLGGGTPSALGAERIARIVGAAREFAGNGAEITVECNPFDAAKKGLDFALLKEAGVNRISMGMQSANDGERRALGRLSGRDDVSLAVRRARDAGIENISLDLMLAVPGQTVDSLRDSVAFCADAGVCHVSAYILKIEEGTRFFERRGELALPDEDKTCELYFTACEGLEKRGFIQYEISNFAKRGCESRHNLKYWNCEEYLGIGPSAHSFIGGGRFFFPRDTESFIANCEPVNDGEGGSFEEYLMLRLRLCEGLIFSEVKERFGHGVPENIIEKCERFSRAGLTVCDGEHIALTRRGFLVSNAVIAELM